MSKASDVAKYSPPRRRPVPKSPSRPGRERSRHPTLPRPTPMSASGLPPKPIVLLPVRARQAADDDHSTRRIPNPAPLGLYEGVHCAGASVRKESIPPLAYFCIRSLAHYADQVSSLGSHRIRCQPEVLRALSPSTFCDRVNAATRCLCKLDPRIWSIIAQIYSDLPEGLRNYYIPLGDRHLPLLQAIPPTSSFALITVLDLTNRISDETSHALKSLHRLCALDISDSSISHLGIRHFAPTATTKLPDPRCGTWGLRILRLCNCPKITDQVVDAVSNFPLLALLGSYHSWSRHQITDAGVDLRRTSCTPDLDSGAFQRSKKSQHNLFQCSLQDAIRQLRDLDSCNTLFSHPVPFVLHINTEFHPSWPQPPGRTGPAPVLPAYTSIQQRFHLSQDSLVVKAERELREWTCSMLGDAANETRISAIADFVMKRWEYDPEWLESDERCDSNTGCPSGDDDSINSRDEGNSTELRVCFSGYGVNEDLVERVWELVDEVREEHESATRFYGSSSRGPKTVVCHCRELRGAATSPAKTIPIDLHLMLLRDPPPWDSIYGSNALPPPRVRFTPRPSLSDSFNHNPDRSSIRAKKFTQDVLDMISHRKSLPITTTSPSLDPTPSAGSNPFRKGSSGGLPRGKLKGLRPEREDSERDGDSDLTPAGPTSKRLKSISQIPIPPWPIPPVASQLEKAKNGGPSRTSSKKHGKLKQTTLLEVFGKRS